MIEKRIKANNCIEALKKEYQDLNDLLIPESEIRLLTELGKGIDIYHVSLRECLTAVVSPKILHKVMMYCNLLMGDLI